MGIPTLRLRADYLAIVTIAAAEIIRLVVRSVKFKDVFGGSDGINDFSGEFRQARHRRRLPAGRARTGSGGSRSPVDETVDADHRLGRSSRIFGTLVYFLMKSPWGRVLKAIREDETAVRSLGKNVYSYKMQSLILGGVIGTFSGMIFALDRGSVQPDNYSRDVTFYVLTALVLGGVAKVVGLDRRADVVLGGVRVHRQRAARVHQGRSAADRRLHADRVDPGRAGHVHARSG